MSAGGVSSGREARLFPGDPHAVDVDAAVQNCLEPWPVDLTDGPRVGDPCNSYYLVLVV